MVSVGTASRLSLIGARLTGPPPIVDVWLPFSPGVHAFYGLNGAGKSRLLYALADLLEAKSGTGYLVARPVPDESAGSRGWSFLTGYRSGDRTEPWPWAAAGSPAWRAVVGDELSKPLFDLLADGTFEVETDDDAWADKQTTSETIITVVNQIVGQDLFALTPTDVGWLASPALLRDPTLPDLAAAIDRVVEAGLRFSLALDETGIDAQHEDAEDLMYRAVRASGLSGIGGTFLPLCSASGALQDGETSEFLEVTRQLSRASTVPFRLGLSDVFWALRHPYADPTGCATVVVRDDQLDIESVTRGTRERLWLESHADGDGVLGEEARPSSALLASASRFASEVQAVYDEVLVNAPALSIRLEDPPSWFIEEPVEWRAVGHTSGLRLDQLSEAQRRWALIAILVASADRPPPEDAEHGLPATFELGPLLADRRLSLLLDEPDAALHATAQRRAVEGLVTLADARQAMVFVATHSQEFLNHAGVTPHHVLRGADHELLVRPLEAPQRARLDELGLTPADALLLYRAVLVVEGTHDEVVLRELIGDELDQLRVLMLPMRGGRLLATVVDSHILAHLSDVPVIAALDNLRAKKVDAFWTDLTNNAQLGQDAFDQIVKAHFTSRERDEETFLINYCRSAVELGQQSRFRVFGFSKADIPEYLPVTSVVPAAESWEALRKQFEAQKRFSSFKPWLAEHYSVHITTDLLRHAAQSLDHVHEDFLVLLGLCRSAQQRDRI